MKYDIKYVAFPRRTTNKPPASTAKLCDKQDTKKPRKAAPQSKRIYPILEHDENREDTRVPTTSINLTDEYTKDSGSHDT